MLESGADHLAPGTAPPEIRRNKGVSQVENPLFGNEIQELRLPSSDIEDKAHLVGTVFYIHTGTIPV